MKSLNFVLLLYIPFKKRVAYIQPCEYVEYHYVLGHVLAPKYIQNEL